MSRGMVRGPRLSRAGRKELCYLTVELLLLQALHSAAGKLLNQSAYHLLNPRCDSCDQEPRYGSNLASVRRIKNCILCTLAPTFGDRCE
jgi:hypothetical protein